MKYYPHLPSRFVVIPRHQGARHQEIMYFDTDPFHVRMYVVCLFYWYAC